MSTKDKFTLYRTTAGNLEFYAKWQSGKIEFEGNIIRNCTFKEAKKEIAKEFKIKEENVKIIKRENTPGIYKKALSKFSNEAMLEEIFSEAKMIEEVLNEEITEEEIEGLYINSKENPAPKEEKEKFIIFLNKFDKAVIQEKINEKLKDKNIEIELKEEPEIIDTIQKMFEFLDKNLVVTDGKQFTIVLEEGFFSETYTKEEIEEKYNVKFII